MLIAFEGIDGAGKTTTTPLVAAKLAELGYEVREATKRNPGIVEEFPREQVAAIGERLWGVPHDERLNSVGSLHWVYLNAAYFAATHHSLSAELGDNGIAVFDNWINKFVARVVTGTTEFDLEQVLQMLQALPQPDMVFFLDVDPKTAASRKQRVSKLERGVLHDGDHDFAGFQTIIRSRLLHMATRFDWITVTPEDRTADEVAEEVAQKVHQRLAAVPANASRDA